MNLRIAILAAGAGDMFCGSCLRDHALAGALIRAGHQVRLIPMYTPLRTETADGNGEVYYGGVNVYLQHLSPVFRRTPRPFDWLLDRPGLLKMAGRWGTQTSPAQLGPLTLSILKGEEGAAVKELRRLVAHLKTDSAPQIVSLPNLMFIGLARMLRQELGVPVVCELTGEDLFLNELGEPHRSEAQAIMRERASDVSRFVATSAYYADEMARYLAIDRSRIDVVYPGVPTEYLAGDMPAKRADRPPTVGYLARICPEKGFGQIAQALSILRKRSMPDATLKAGGYLGGANRPWFDDIMRRTEGATYVGELDRGAKLELLDSIDVLSVPTIYAEAKGIYVLEAMSRGVPVVQPAHGSFPELIERTGGGILTPPGDLDALADALAELLHDPDRRAKLGQAGRDAIRAGFTDAHMAQKMLDVYRSTIAQSSSMPA